MIPAGMPHDLTFAHRELLYLLALPALVLLWGIVNARELRRVWLWDEWPGRWGADVGTRCSTPGLRRDLRSSLRLFSSLVT